MSAGDIIEAALEARTLEQAENVNRMIEREIGRRYRRPLGDKWNNFGLMAQGGSFDIKLIEIVTNMQDAVLERVALSRYGDRSRVPYRTPREAAAALFAGRNPSSLADEAVVEFHESDPPAARSKRLTVVGRDHGCGMTPAMIPHTIFALGSDHKGQTYWLQGAFGLGGETPFRNARAVVLVTRRAPELLGADEEDRIAVAVVVWEPHGKGESACYLVTRPWNGPGDVAEPYSAPASEFPGFEPGTHLALISYGVEGYHRRRLGDEKSFDTVFNTRLFEPIMPVRFRNVILRERSEVLRGLAQRLADNPRPDRREGAETLPYSVGGRTYHLPIRYYVFAKPGEAGERRKFVAHDHAVIFTSNGQAHYHWTPADFKSKTRLRKLYDRIFVVVEMDELPIEVRTSFFTADRSALVRNDAAIRLEQQVIGFLDEWGELVEINNEILRETISGSSDSRSTIDVARRISRALQVAGGYRHTTTGGTAGGRGGGRVVVPTPPIELYPDPTILEGPEHVKAEPGKTRFITFRLNAVDDFLPRRGRLTVTCDHPEIGEREITVGRLRSGRVRISVAIPEDADVGTYRLEVALRDWLRSTGGLGQPLSWTTKLEIVSTRERRPGGGETGTGGVEVGPLVALLWQKVSDRPGEWNATVVGDVEPIPAQILAEKRPEYGELAALGEQQIRTVVLNEEFSFLKEYVKHRARELSPEGIARLKDRYAVGVGVGMLMLDDRVEERRKAGDRPDERWIRDAQQAVAHGTLSIMPEFDELAREAGLEQ